MPNIFGAKYMKLLTLVTMTANVTDSDKSFWKISSFAQLSYIKYVILLA